MDEILRHLGNIYDMDRATLGVIVALCAVAAFTIKDYMANPFMAILVFPLLVVFSVGAKYLFILGEMYPFRKLDQWLIWTVAAAIVGNAIGIALVALITRVSEALRPNPLLAREASDRGTPAR
jgi:fucose 4-O-acetylase-like acetyltransferase